MHIHMHMYVHTQGEYDFDGMAWEKVSEGAKSLIRMMLVLEPGQRATPEKCLEVCLRVRV